jgi:colanic acid/amylovoran biosynthesis glycosyltransferase
VPSRSAGPPPRVPVLHAVHRFGLPSETFIRDAIVELDALGWRPWVVTEAIDSEWGSVPPTRIVLPPRTRPLVDRVARRITAGHGRDPLREMTARNYLAALSCMPAGLLHAHFGWTGADCVLAAQKLSLPFVVSFHGTDLTVLAQDPAWTRYYGALLTRADGVTVVSRFLEARLRGLGYEGRIDLIPSGVRLAAFPLREGRRPGDAPSLLFVGRLVAGKGVDVLLAALGRVRADGLSATLRVVGDGPLRADLEAATRSQGLGDAVGFLGARSHAEVRDELTRADIVVVPSQVIPGGLEEGSSVVSKEAQAIGVPVVATRVGGIPETLPPDLRHELVPPGGDEAFASGIVHLWNAREHWPERVRLQRDWIAGEFAWENVARKLSDVYERVLAERPPVNARLARALRRRPGRQRRSR